ncbi:MAG: UDP-N-acetylmuramoyl-L-alanyl-D-glutamate--2,6-diaminopimelate ligase [Cyclobacteriaceae bacterium]|nr:MAG: UDP-N-acetylmuramoyl-L-alanyl-D-glutamate--2,6-diaminopimelate ligase [Cyclobacteriaceae bacterium]
MAKLKEILYKVSLLSVSGDTEKDISGIYVDSRKVAPNGLFVAINGTTTNGHHYIDDAIKRGAIAVLCEKMPETLGPEITYITVNDSADALGKVAGNFYGNPSAKLQLVAITGTNGKTTTATLLFQLFRGLGYQVGLISTVNNRINDNIQTSTLTTPDAITINELLDAMVKQGCTHCFMEASSHAIDQKRISGLNFTGAVFTNISHDHLDYHGTFEAYISIKKKLFDDLPKGAFALVNIDDKRGLIMLQNTRARKLTYSLKRVADFKGKILANTIRGLELEIDHTQVWFKLMGEFNAYNLVSSYGVAMLLDESSEEVLRQLSDMGPAPGRFDQLQTASGITAIVDYAHTPDALDKVLATIKAFRTGHEQLITVVGCGGNRDKTKRPIMANIACKHSDRVILTSDNPRDESPEAILNDMQKGVNAAFQKKVLTIVDRKEAIKTACALSTDKDIILVAGKGHETYQEIKGIRHDFDDKVILTQMMELVKGGAED